MGQKSNSNILRVGIGNRTWDSKYLEKTIEESTFLVYQDLKIRDFIVRFLKLHGLLLYNCNINRTDVVLNIHVSFFTLLNSVQIINTVNASITKELIDTSSFSDSSSGTSTSKNKVARQPSVLNSKKTWYKTRYKKKINFLSQNFIFKLLSSLNNYLKNKYRINLVVQNLNKGLSSRLTNSEATEFRNIIMQLRVYFKSPFFRETINILLISIKNKLKSKILTEFIALKLSGMKRHNYFLTFLKRTLVLVIKSTHFEIKGVKLKIKGRFNGVPRSSTRLIQVGKVPLQTLKSKIDYSSTTSFTANGTFGVQLWIF